MASHRVLVVADEGQFQTELANAGAKLVVVDFFASWCGPCQRIAPSFEQFSRTYPNAVFLKVDVDQTPDVAHSRDVRAMPTFLFYKNMTKVDSLQGADPASLEAKIKQHYEGEDGVQGDAPVKGHGDLNSFLNKSGCECLNESDDHPFTHAITQKGGYLESDCDEQLIIHMAFNQAVKLHSLQLLAPEDKGPKTIKIFINQPHTLDFDQCENMEPLQKFDLTPDDMKEGATIGLRYVKYQNVQTVTIFVKDNQKGTETTQIDYIAFIGSPVSTTNMSDFKRVAGKKGESH
ncbi:thioredoxin-like protein 1 [Liolophura sinensis]|uniref:thioredoxin-like protein 1 n=1 Tax=Liolophura sinensis TaxID=3198878 RepID=UPI00315898CE